MSEFSRRDMLGAAAAGGVAAAATGTETFGQGQPPFGPTPAPLAGTELPSFRFELGAVAPKRWDAGWAKEATVAEFPVSQALAGVLMSLVPGGLRSVISLAAPLLPNPASKGVCYLIPLSSTSRISGFPLRAAGRGDADYAVRSTERLDDVLHQAVIAGNT